MFDPVLIEVGNAGPMTGAGNNTYLLAAPNGGAGLIDAGVGTIRHLDAIGTHLGRLGARLRSVLITHGHADHASGAPAIRRAFEPDRFAKYPSPSDDPKIPWVPLADGDACEAGDTTLIAIHTPGHAPDHVVFWHEPARTAFVGDLVIANRSVVIAWSRGGDVAAYLTSLERLLSLDPARLLPAHGNAIDDPARVLLAAIDHRLEREQQVLSGLAAGRETVPAIADSIYHGVDTALLPLARESVRAHLEKLKNDGRAIAAGDRWHRVGV
jgi:glyoxylase-like metal-dependent hydrolase (beta-lactamase superfamily II)